LNSIHDPGRLSCHPGGKKRADLMVRPFACHEGDYIPSMIPFKVGLGRMAALVLAGSGLK